MSGSVRISSTDIRKPRTGTRRRAAHDLALLRENLLLTPTERLRRAAVAANGIAVLRAAMARARSAGR